MRLTAPTLVLLPLLTGPALGQGPAPAYVADTGTDSIWRLEDLDGDGSYNGPGEVTAYYDEQLGTVLLGNNTGITVGDDGAVYVSDSSSDLVLRLVDTDGDGDCNAPTDHVVWFDGGIGGNLSGVEMISAQNVLWTPGDVLLVASANTSAGVDQIIRLEDLNGDGDANDAGEAVSIFEPLVGGAVGDSIVQDVRLGLDGALYYLENGSTGAIAKGVYRLVDGDGDGLYDPATEVAPFFIPPALATTPFHWQFHQGPDGTFYMADTGNDVIWRFRDDDGDGAIDAQTEASTWWTSTTSSLIWSVFAPGDGWVYACESQAPDRLLRMRDADGNGIVDPINEVETLYDDTLAAANISNPRGLHVDGEGPLGEVFCGADGTATACPCGNLGATDTGCANSTGAGASLSGAGSGEVADDDVTLSVAGAPAGVTGLFFSGESGDPAGTLFGDGLRCAVGPVLRLEIVLTGPDGSAASGAPLAAAGGLQPGDTRSYQFWYRDPVGSPCGAGFNTTNGFRISWQ